MKEEATITDFDLLEEIMSARELIEELRDMSIANRREQIDSLSKITQSRIEKLVAQIESSFLARNFDEALQHLHTLSYVVKISREISQLD